MTPVTWRSANRCQIVPLMQNNKMILIFCSVIIAALLASALAANGPAPGMAPDLAAFYR